jgi:hypothetical protein
MVTISLSLWYVAVRWLHEAHAGRRRQVAAPPATSPEVASTLPAASSSRPVRPSE